MLSLVFRNESNIVPSAVSMLFHFVRQPIRSEGLIDKEALPKTRLLESTPILTHPLPQFP